ncbi:MAG: DUF4166 domain-containing protein [Reyranellaceae bacterium]
MTPPLRLLVIGGYGTFGGRLVDLLANEPRLAILVAGRSEARAEAFCRARQRAMASLHPVAFDRGGDLETQLSRLAPDVAVDASGPFQAYGTDPYRLVRACIARRVSYLDLADGADFVGGIGAFDAAAAAAGVFVLSGVSSFPVLTAAVARALAHDMTCVRTITAGIAPSPFAGVGENVIRAIASYAGRPVRLRREGVWTTGYPFTDGRRFVVAPPGWVPLESRHFSLVEVPDLQALATLWPDARDIWIGAAPVPPSLHFCLRLLARLVRWRLLPSLRRLAPLMLVATNRLRWGDDRGGMFVAVTGEDAERRPVDRSWHLLAEGQDGPLIPSMAVEGLVRGLLAGKMPAPGARSAVQELELADYERLFADRRIATGFRRDASGQRLYRGLLGSAWEALAPEIRALPDLGETIEADGRAIVERGTGLLSRLVAAFVGFPAATDDVALRVRFSVTRDGEVWTRTFGRRSFSSRQWAGRGRSERLLCERFGPVTVAMAPVVAEGRLRLVLRRWSFLGVPLPLALGPRADVVERAAAGRFAFDVAISHSLTGLIVRYRGWLATASAKA